MVWTSPSVSKVNQYLHKMALIILFYFNFNFMEIATAKAESITRTGLPHSHNPSSQPLIWQHDNKSLKHREQIDGSTVCYVHPGGGGGYRNKLLLPEGTLM